ncbi:MAG: hypothetical protein ACYCQJ_12940 [Nitrososphaerales archaeon]
MKYFPVLACSWLVLSLLVFPLIAYSVAPSCCAQVSPKVEYITPSAEYYFSEVPDSLYAYWTGQEYSPATKLLYFNSSSDTPSILSADGALHDYGFAFALNTSSVVGSVTPVLNFTAMGLISWVNYTETAPTPSQIEVVLINCSVPLAVWYDNAVALGKSTWSNFASAQGDAWAYNVSVTAFNGPALFVKSAHISSTVRNIAISWVEGVPGSNGNGNNQVVTTVNQNHIVNVTLPGPVNWNNIPELIVENFRSDPILLVLLVFVLGLFYVTTRGKKARRNVGQ